MNLAPIDNVATKFVPKMLVTRLIIGRLDQTLLNSKANPVVASTGT